MFYNKDDGSLRVGVDFQILRLLGKRLIFHFRGSEIRIQLFNQLNPFSWLKEEEISSIAHKKLIEQKEIPFVFDEDGQIDFLNKVNRLAHQVLVTDPELKSYAPNTLICPRVVNDELFVGQERLRAARSTEFSGVRSLVIGHAPSRPYIKGTPALLDAVEQPQREGHH